MRRVTKCNLEIMTLCAGSVSSEPGAAPPAAARRCCRASLFGSVAPPALLKLCNKPPDLLAVFCVSICVVDQLKTSPSPNCCRLGGCLTRSMLKMLLDPMGGIVITNDGNCILREVRERV